jgi:tRNA(adenine34) deaminase
MSKLEDQDELDVRYMREAIKQAINALDKDEVPIGAVIVHGKTIIAKGFNQTETLNDVTAHAEMQAFTAAADYLGGKYLTDCTLYVTLEPCVMCAGASYWTQISRIVFGAYDTQRGFTRINQTLTHPKTEFIGGIKAEECGALVRDFFKSKRSKS